MSTTEEFKATYGIYQACREGLYVAPFGERLGEVIVKDNYPDIELIQDLIDGGFISPFGEFKVGDCGPSIRITDCRGFISHVLLFEGYKE